MYASFIFVNGINIFVKCSVIYCLKKLIKLVEGVNKHSIRYKLSTCCISQLVKVYNTDKSRILNNYISQKIGKDIGICASVIGCVNYVTVYIGK